MLGQGRQQNSFPFGHFSKKFPQSVLPGSSSAALGHKFEFDHELAERMRASHEQFARDAATAEYHRTTEWMLRVAAKLFLRIAVAVTLLVLLAWLFVG